MGFTGPASLTRGNLFINKFTNSGSLCTQVNLPPADILNKNKTIIYATSTNACVDIVPQSTTIAGGITSLKTDEDGFNLSLLYGGYLPRWNILNNNGFISS